MGLTGNYSIRIPTASIRPVLHPSAHIVHFVIHGPNIIGSRSAPSTSKTTVGMCNLCLRLIIRTPFVKVRRGSPLVSNDFGTSMKGERKLKHVLTKDFIERASRNGLHAFLRVLDVIGKVPIRINGLFRSLISRIAQCIGRGNNDETSGGDQSCQPLTMMTGDATVGQLVPTSPCFRGGRRIGSIGFRLGFARSGRKKQRGCFHDGGGTDPFVAVQRSRPENLG
mmetsp:Transcript_18688/g.43368  ORF Transcript_18688/g.43368 Transcript_18688/m.43368 type:complete len:224 (-) Transcript_18688:487-1158(-)